MASRIQEIESSLRSARGGEQGGISEPQIACVTLNFSEARPYLFPTNRSQVEKGNERRVTDVKGAERKTFQRLSRGVFHFVLKTFGFLPTTP